MIATARSGLKQQSAKERMWRAYHRQRSEANRNRLVEAYMPIVERLAGNMLRTVPCSVERDDLVSSGTFGLMQSVEAFDPLRRVKFETYCVPRIRGAMLDELRAVDHVPRVVRERSKRLERMRDGLASELGRLPTDDEMSAHMGLTPAEYSRLRQRSRAVPVESLHRNTGVMEDQAGDFARNYLGAVEDPKSVNPVQLRKRQDFVRSVTKGLSRTERTIVVLYYFEELTMDEIGYVLGLSESRISQIHKELLKFVRKRFTQRAELAEIAG